MPQETLPAALIGAGGFGIHALQALRRSGKVRLTGISDRDRSAAEAGAAEALCPAYSDHRRLLVETRPEAAFLAVPPAPAAELVRLAAERRLHVWKQAPLARSLPEAVELCRRMDRARRRFAVGTQRRFMSSYRRAKSLLGGLGQVYLLQGHYLCNWGADSGWRGDRAAGGGALMELGYPLFDLVIWLLGVPETVYSVVGAVPADRRPKDQPVYDTDDTFTVVCRYHENVAATVTASRCFSPVSEGLTAYCEGGSLTADPARCVVRDRDGKVLAGFQGAEPPAAVFTRMIDDFVDAAAGEESAGYEASAWENLLTMAAVDAAYLSDRTNQPEPPARLLRNYDVTLADCRKAVRAKEPARETK